MEIEIVIPREVKKVNNGRPKGNNTLGKKTPTSKKHQYEEKQLHKSKGVMVNRLYYELTYD